MWYVTLIAKKQFDDTITFKFDSVLTMSNFIDTAVKTSVDTLEITIKYVEENEGQKEGEQNE